MRKVLSVALTLALALGTFSFAATAADSDVKLLDIADNANEEAIQVTYDLKIVEGTPEGNYEPDKAVNRAEFAALVTRALAIPQSALSSYSTSSFLDTAGYGWAVPYLAFCQQRGILKGDGYGNVMPGRTISPNEAVTMVARAIGYTDNASVLVGQWPANYVSLGQSLQLYHKVDSATEMTKASAAQMIYNALTVQLVQVDSNSYVEPLWNRISATRSDPRSLLTAGLDCAYHDPGVITYDNARKSKINLTPYVGAYGVLYTSNLDGEVVAATEIETTFIPGRFTWNSDGTVNKFKSLTDGTEYNLSTGDKWAVKELRVSGGDITPDIENNSFLRAGFFNGDDGFSATTDISNYLPSTGTAIQNIDKFNKLIVAGKVSGQTITELRSIAVWDADKGGDHFLFASDTISGKKFGGHDLPLDNANEVNLNGFNLVGANYIEDIEVNDVVYVYKNKDKKVARIEVGTETQAGAVTRRNVDDTDYTVGGTTLKLAPYEGLNRSSMELNSEGTALLDYYGRIYDFDLGEASKGSYAVAIESGSDNFTNTVVKLFDAKGAENIYSMSSSYDWPLAKNSKINRLGHFKLSSGKLSQFTNSEDGVPLSKVNKEGTVLTAPDKSNMLIDANVAVFVVDKGDYSVGSINDLKDTELTEAFQYYRDPDNRRVTALLVSAVDAGASNVFVMINKRTDGYTDGDIDVITGLSFADGVGASAKTWEYTDKGLMAVLSSAAIDIGITNGSSKWDKYQSFTYPEIVKFRVGEDNVLKQGELIDLRIDGATTGGGVGTGAGVYVNPDNITGGPNGTFTIGFGSVNNQGVIHDYASFEANTVMYKMDGPNWSAVTPNRGAFTADIDPTGVVVPEYIFLKTDKDKAYDIIIKVK
ncbi:MAG: S-layer homology domain-containing protein [Clostridiales Family XIII bacterium]|jgi:hypothetical protein|nr:S-layer homology domain-containing protein [Clostridiales Family XIII bacterium]